MSLERDNIWGKQAEHKGATKVKINILILTFLVFTEKFSHKLNKNKTSGLSKKTQTTQALIIICWQERKYTKEAQI